MANVTFVDRNSDLHAIEGSLRNKFRWFWLEEIDSNGDILAEYLRKIPEPGIAYCLFCKQRLNYSTKGKSFITRHAQSKSHIRHRSDLKTNQSLPAAFQSVRHLEEGSSSRPTMTSASGSVVTSSLHVEKAISSSSSVINIAQLQVQRPPSMKDRISHQEAIICSFIAKHSLPLSMAPNLIGLAQLLAQDHKALQSLSMERQTATYKLKYGLKEVQRKRLVSKLKSVPFSFNIDESTTKHGKKRETVFHAVKDKLMEDKVPLANLISVLSDSAAYMRGVHNGFFPKLKEVAPHLIDIDGDICHHVHNISKLFCASVDGENVISFLMDDLYRDFEYCTDLRKEFSSVCETLKMKSLLPKERVAHRWLNILECCQRFVLLKDALLVFYFSFMPANDKHIFQSYITSIFQQKNVTTEGRSFPFKIMHRVKSKNMIDQGKAREKRIVKKLFDLGQKTDSLIDIFNSVLPVFQKFVLIFERKTQLHLLHDELVKVFTMFLQFHVKPEYIRESGKDLSILDLSANNVYLPSKHIICWK